MLRISTMVLGRAGVYCQLLTKCVLRSDELVGSLKYESTKRTSDYASTIDSSPYEAISISRYLMPRSSFILTK